MLLWSSAIKFDVVGRGQSIAKSTGETKKSTTVASSQTTAHISWSFQNGMVEPKLQVFPYKW